ncbi:hypothetical protein [Pseudoxanthomonas sp. Root630]|uniref:hypothetical protein n=1 Tax=Pseudoxanthomonas sp. Root630 TaxID=1736574 RepID=UPI0012DDE576|nr:hypothetical protein [Pseudoxanthomonas sp. Root630]
MQKAMLLLCARRAVASFCIAVGVALVLYALVDPPVRDTEGSCSAGGHVLLFLGLVFFSPLVETLVLAILYSLSRFFFNSLVSTCFAAVALASLHALVWWGWAVIVLVPFMLFAIPFSVSSDTIEKKFMYSLMMHSFHNFYVFLAVILATLFGC